MRRGTPANHQYGVRGARGGRGSSVRNTAPQVSLPSDRDLKENLKATAVQTIAKPSADPLAGNIVLKDVEYIGSYDWIDEAEPTIIVPGAPAAWADKPMPFRVPADTGVRYVDQNTHRMPSATFLPLFTAVDKKSEHDCTPSFDWPSVDFVTDRNGLRKLLRWINDSDAKEFRVDMQLAGRKTVLLNRWEKRTQEALPGYTFGFGYEKACSGPAQRRENSVGHHRIISYDLDGLKVVVRFEVDAYLPLQKPSNLNEKQKITPGSVDDLIDSIGTLNISPSANASGRASHGGSELLKVITGGSYDVAQASLIEITTISQKRFSEGQFNWTEQFPQLFLSQTPHLFIGVHNRGEFIRSERPRLGQRQLKDAEDKAHANLSLRKLRRVLGDIQKIVIDAGEEGRLSLVMTDGQLKVYERTKMDSCLPDDMMLRFESV